MSLMNLMSPSEEKSRPREDRRKTPPRLHRSPFLAKFANFARMPKPANCIARIGFAPLARKWAVMRADRTPNPASSSNESPRVKGASRIARKGTAPPQKIVLKYCRLQS